MIFIMIDYLIIGIVVGKAVAMLVSFHRVGRTKFVFTMRTEVRLGGCEMHV